ncbi:glycoside hydrolase family 5 protein [Lentzea alba]|uniref:glycoside hydrolase family 5 protein n=1 Tax=Lentzea alba TaxID=2714351 RepID=UPI0039BF344E
MKLRRVVLGLSITAALLTGSVPATAAAPARLSVSGANVVDPAGNPIVLRGYNWGHWGTVQPKDPGDHVAAGANSVRIPLRWWGEWKDNVDSYDDDPDNASHIKDEHLTLLTKTIEQASAAGLWITLFVDSDYGQGANGSRENFWTKPEKRQEFKEVWQFLVRKFKNTPYMGAFEILPEPKPINQTDEAVRKFYEEMTLAIREIDRRTPVVVGPNDNYSCSKLEESYTSIDPKIIYTCNYFIFEYPLNRIQRITDFRRDYNVPMWINQVGIEGCDTDDVALGKANTVLDAFKTNAIGWAWWTYRLNGTNECTHGIYHLDPTTPTGWKLKKNWRNLVNGYLAA